MSKEKNVSSFLQTASPAALVKLSRYDLLIQDHPLVGYLLGRASTILLAEGKSRDIFISFCTICISLATLPQKMKDLNLYLLKQQSFWRSDTSNEERIKEILDFLGIKFSYYSYISKLVTGLLDCSVSDIYMDVGDGAKMFDQYRTSSEKSVVYKHVGDKSRVSPGTVSGFISIIDSINDAFLRRK